MVNLTNLAFLAHLGEPGGHTARKPRREAG